VVFSPDGDLLVTLGKDKEVRVWSVEAVLAGGQSPS
jgi:hypothetical protein